MPAVPPRADARANSYGLKALGSSASTIPITDVFS